MTRGPEYLPRSTLGGKPLPFSSAVRIGDILYLSGQMGFRDDGTLPDGMEAQATQTLENIGRVLETAGLGFGDVFHCTVILADMSQWAGFNGCRRAARSARVRWPWAVSSSWNARPTRPAKTYALLHGRNSFEPDAIGGDRLGLVARGDPRDQKIVGL